MLKQIRHIILGILFASLALPAARAAAAPGPITPNQVQTEQPIGQDMRLQNRIGLQPIFQGQLGHSMYSIDTQYAQRKRISASQAKSAALNRVRGARFVNVQLVNQSTYRVRLQQKNGRIVDVYVDAYTGRVKG